MTATKPPRCPTAPPIAPAALRPDRLLAALLPIEPLPPACAGGDHAGAATRPRR
jgi:hypothetical protein